MAAVSKRVLVTGSRGWTNVAWLRHVLAEHFAGDTVLVHGGARGADRLAADAWLEMGGQLECWSPDWGTQGKAAGFIRNKQMVKSGIDLCLAFWDGQSKGTEHTIDLCERAGVPVALFVEPIQP
jgi:hypothetical protein